MTHADECGKSKYDDAATFPPSAMKRAIVGGTEARENEFPWQVCTYYALCIPRWTYDSGFRVDLQIASVNHSTTNGMHIGIFRIRVHVNEHCFSAHHRCYRCLFKTFPVVAPTSTSVAVSLFTRCGCWQRLTVSKRQWDVISNHMYCYPSQPTKPSYHCSSSAFCLFTTVYWLSGLMGTWYVGGYEALLEVLGASEFLIKASKPVMMSLQRARRLRGCGGRSQLGWGSRSRGHS